MFMGPCIVNQCQELSNKMRLHGLLYLCNLLYMFRLLILPIIRSTYNCNYSIWHWSNRLCYLPLWWSSWNGISGGNSTHHQEHI